LLKSPNAADSMKKSDACTCAPKVPQPSVAHAQVSEGRRGDRDLWVELLGLLALLGKVPELHGFGGLLARIDYTHARGEHPRYRKVACLLGRRRWGEIDEEWA
jgi:hypothetical protein